MGSGQQKEKFVALLDVIMKNLETLYLVLEKNAGANIVTSDKYVVLI